MQLKELQLYTNNITSCLDMVDIISERRQDHQWKNTFQCETIFTSLLYTNYNNFYQEFVLQTKTEKSSIPKKPIILIISRPTNKRSGSSEKIPISTEATTIPTSTSSFL